MPFRDVVGHRRLVALLSRSIARGIAAAEPDLRRARRRRQAADRARRRAGAQLPRPIAHESPAAELRARVDACGACAACTRIARGVHPDVLFVEPGDNGSIKIDQVRDVVDRAAYRPFEGRRRVVIIDEADALVPPAQNALLKTLEEPPPSSVFILVTARPDMLLPTVRSRCPQLRFRPLSADEIAAALMARGRSETEARAVAATADGSLGRALAGERRAISSRRARSPQRVLVQRGGAATIRARRIEGAKDLLAKTGAAAPAIAISSPRTCARWRRCCATSSCWRRGADAATLANADVAARARAAAPAFDGERGRRGVRGRRPRAGGARPQRRRQDRRRLAGAAAMSTPTLPRPLRSSRSS